VKYAIVVPWVTDEEIAKFKEAWGVEGEPDWLVLQQDENHEGCGATKNAGVQEASRREADVVVVLDGDCYPYTYSKGQTLPALAEAHIAALEPQQVELFATVTSPPSRGTPYSQTTVKMPVACSMGFWAEVGDYCAPRQLSYGARPMTFYPQSIYGKYFALSGMNIAFKPQEWRPWCSFIEVPRFDDIWMGWLWQREAYRRKCCFNLAGPIVRHARQSNVWKNLKLEAEYLEASETLWREIAMNRADDYKTLRRLLPC